MMKFRLAESAAHLAIGVALTLLWFYFPNAWAVLMSFGIAGVTIAVVTRSFG